MGGDRDAQIVVQLTKDVLQTARQRPHRRCDGEGPSDRVPRGGVGVLAEDEHLHAVERLTKGAQHLAGVRKDLLAGGPTPVQLLPQLGELFATRGQRLIPGGIEGRDEISGELHGHPP